MLLMQICQLELQEKEANENDLVQEEDSNDKSFQAVSPTYMCYFVQIDIMVSYISSGGSTSDPQL